MPQAWFSQAGPTAATTSTCDAGMTSTAVTDFDAELEKRHSEARSEIKISKKLIIIERKTKVRVTQVHEFA